MVAARVCGACTVHIDGAARRSREVAVKSIGTAKIHTIEQIGSTAIGARLQRAWLKIDVVQCGYCQVGHIMAASAFLARTDRPEPRQIDTAMAGNICRCGCYHWIRAAIGMVAVADQENCHVT
jgi:isoquinoline 1-oxidoreductase alpha subunit